MRALGLQAARDTVAAHFAPRHMDQIRSLLIDARRFMLRWGEEALAQWSTEEDANGYAGVVGQKDCLENATVMDDQVSSHILDSAPNMQRSLGVSESLASEH